MKPRTRGISSAVLGVAISFSILMAFIPRLSLETFAQTEDEAESEEAEVSNMSNVARPGGTFLSM
jgi:hypothetical protein